MAVYCSNCGAKLDEKDVFCGACGAPVAKDGSAAKSSNAASAKNYRMVGIAVIAVVVLIVGGLVLKGFGGGKKDDGKTSGPIVTGAEDEAPEEEDEVLAHLEPWMGEWMLNYKVDPSQPLSLMPEHEGYYHGHILTMGNSNGEVHVNEQYIDFSDFTKDQKDCIPVSALTYYESAYGADVFEDTDSGRRILFYKHFKVSQDYGEMMRVEAYVGSVEPEITYVGDTPFAANHQPDSDGWAADVNIAFVRVDE